MDDDRAVAARAAAEAFETLGNELRANIVLALLDGPRTFSQLREAVGVADSGRFNYHLDQLTGQFVRKTEEGYRLRYHGDHVARSMLAGTFTETTAFEPVPVDGDCIECGDRALMGSYADERVHIDCDACGERVLTVGFPPTAVADRAPGEAIEAFERWSRHQAAMERDGVCAVCTSRVRTTLAMDPPRGIDLSPVVSHECVVCERLTCTAVGGAVVDHPEVVAFHAEAGRDPRAGPYWSNPYLVTNRHVEVRSREPLRVDVTFSVDDETLVVTVDDHLDVVETTVE
jgi:DNA-directed RNA polymerase subunit RPC12/RpoP